MSYNEIANLILALTKAKMHEIPFRLWELSADSLAGFKGAATSKGKEGRGKEEKRRIYGDRKERGGEVEGVNIAWPDL